MGYPFIKQTINPLSAYFNIYIFQLLKWSTKNFFSFFLKFDFRFHNKQFLYRQTGFRSLSSTCRYFGTSRLEIALLNIIMSTSLRNLLKLIDHIRLVTRYSSYLLNSDQWIKWYQYNLFTANSYIYAFSFQFVEWTTEKIVWHFSFNIILVDFLSLRFCNI